MPAASRPPITSNEEDLISFLTPMKNEKRFLRARSSLKYQLITHNGDGDRDTIHTGVSNDQVGIFDGEPYYDPDFEARNGYSPHTYPPCDILPPKSKVLFVLLPLFFTADEGLRWI
jgi:hypothetical protein